MSFGWVKFYRQALDNGWLRNHRLWVFWSYCLLKASHKPTTVSVGFQRVALEAGQFVFGRKQAAAELGMTERQVRTCMSALTSLGNLAIKTTNKFSVISVVNWHSYQDGGDQNDQQVTSNRPTSDHKQEVKEFEKVKKRSNTSSSPDSDGHDLFDVFWKAYPRKTHKVEARRAFMKLKPDGDLVSEMLKTLEWQRELLEWKEDGGQFIPYPASWLKARRWEDEPYEPPSVNHQLRQCRTSTAQTVRRTKHGNRFKG